MNSEAQVIAGVEAFAGYPRHVKNRLTLKGAGAQPRLRISQNYQNIGPISRQATNARISSSEGGRSNRLAASRAFGSTWMSPGVFKKTSDRPSTYQTARSTSACSSNGSYQVARVGG